MYSLIDDPSGMTYHALIDWLVARCSSALLVRRNEMELSTGGEAIIAQLEPHLESRSLGTAWPGTVLLAGKAELLRYQCSDLFGAVLKRSADSLFAWCQPDRPEDLSFARADGSILIKSTSHEREANFHIDERELISLREAVTQLKWNQ